MITRETPLEPAQAQARLKAALQHCSCPLQQKCLESFLEGLQVPPKSAKQKLGKLDLPEKAVQTLLAWGPGLRRTDVRLVLGHDGLTDQVLACFT
jgi:hypothetical protein